MNIFIKIYGLALDILFPHICANCGKFLKDKNEVFCALCAQKINTNTAFCCPLCRKRIPPSSRTCHPETKYVLGAVTNYDCEPLQKIVKLLKYNRLQDKADFLGNFMYEYSKVVKLKIENFIVMPIPLASRKLRERGFNQAELIARGFLRFAGKPELLMAGNLVRVKNTDSQVNMETYKDRASNVSGCFKVRDPFLVAGRNVILVDDVHTSGHTMGEAARVLKEGGARKIIALTVLKA